jgi:ATP-dependent DNA helicase PIF1
LTGDRANKEVFIPRIKIINETDFPYVLMRHQFPVRLAAAITINRGQGQSYNMIGIDFRKPSFSHGQTYVALSRTRAWDCIQMLVPPDTKENKIKNVVYKEILQDE